MAASNYITDKVQRALQSFLQLQAYADISAEIPWPIPDTQIYKGIENITEADHVVETAPVTRLLPCVECVCQSAETVDEHFLSWLADAEVWIRTNADDTTEDTHHAICAEVLNKITTDTIAADLTAALADFTCFLVNFRTQSWEIVDRSWRSVIRFDVHCAGSDIS